MPAELVRPEPELEERDARALGDRALDARVRLAADLREDPLLRALLPLAVF